MGLDHLWSSSCVAEVLQKELQLRVLDSGKDFQEYSMWDQHCGLWDGILNEPSCFLGRWGHCAIFASIIRRGTIIAPKMQIIIINPTMSMICGLKEKKPESIVPLHQIWPAAKRGDKRIFKITTIYLKKYTWILVNLPTLPKVCPCSLWVVFGDGACRAT